MRCPQKSPFFGRFVDTSLPEQKRGQARLILRFGRFVPMLSIMPRAPRASVGGICYHVMNRGNSRRAVFHKDGDYQAFLKAIGHACIEIPMPVLGFCLLPNHFHLVVWPKEDGDLSRWMH